jgi:hypothetical protein
MREADRYSLVNVPDEARGVEQTIRKAPVLPGRRNHANDLQAARRSAAASCIIIHGGGFVGGARWRTLHRPAAFDLNCIMSRLSLGATPFPPSRIRRTRLDIRER